jgi:predicted RNA binding protein YcfA (HicA-like mRNA interferase family)
VYFDRRANYFPTEAVCFFVQWMHRNHLLQKLAKETKTVLVGEKSLRYLRFLLFIFLSSLAALLGIGWRIKRESRGSHRILSRPGWPDVVFAFHDAEEIGPKMLARIKKRTGLTPNDL